MQKLRMLEALPARLDSRLLHYSECRDNLTLSLRRSIKVENAAITTQRYSRLQPTSLRRSTSFAGLRKCIFFFVSVLYFYLKISLFREMMRK
jgi:hypothetical protein